MKRRSRASRKPLKRQRVIKKAKREEIVEYPKVNPDKFPSLTEGTVSRTIQGRAWNFPFRIRLNKHLIHARVLFPEGYKSKFATKSIEDKERCGEVVEILMSLRDLPRPSARSSLVRRKLGIETYPGFFLHAFYSRFRDEKCKATEEEQRGMKGLAHYLLCEILLTGLLAEAFTDDACVGLEASGYIGTKDKEGLRRLVEYYRSIGFESTVPAEHFEEQLEEEMIPMIGIVGNILSFCVKFPTIAEGGLPIKRTRKC